MNAARKQRMFAKWDGQVQRLLNAVEGLDKNHSEWSNALMRKCLGVESWDRELFFDWLDGRLDRVRAKHSRWATACHEAGHAVVSELLLPGSVTYADCYREAQGVPGESGEEHGITEYDIARLRQYSQASPLTGPYQIVACLASRDFEAELSDSSPESVHFGTSGDRDSIRGYFTARRMRRRDRKSHLEFAEGVLESLASSDAVRAAVRAVADMLLRDGHISGDEVREIIAAEIGSVEKLLSSLGIPRVEAEQIAKAA